jgi:hypothetical protein
MLAVAISLAVLVGLALGWSAEHLLHRDPYRRFTKEFAALVADTPIEWEELHGPGPDAAPNPALRSYAAPAANAESLAAAAKPLSNDDLEYYAASWRNVRGQFARHPASALRLARHLTANLMINRGLIPRDSAEPTRLPPAWTFPTARGYRDALRIADRAEQDEGTVDDFDLARALSLFEEFYWEILALEPARR